MGKNLIPEIAKMFGVEIGEEFKIDITVAEKLWTKRSKQNDGRRFD